MMEALRRYDDGLSRLEVSLQDLSREQVDQALGRAKALFAKLHAEDPDDACVALHLARMEGEARDALVVMDSK